MHIVTTLGALAALALAGATWPEGALAQPSGSTGRATIDEITVIGRYPGPPLWRVSSGERVLWIFGELSPVLEGLDFDPRNAERIIQRADSVIGPPRISAPTYNPFKIFRMLRAARRLSRNPEGSSLADVLPPDLFERYEALRRRYLEDGDDGDNLRPALAVLRLHGAALEDVGLTTDSGVRKQLERLMRRSSAQESEARIKTEAATVLEELGRIPRAAELSCFASVLTSLETDLEGMKERAAAWAIGDVYALRQFDYPDPQGDCLAMLFTASGLASLRDELYATWLGEAERALATHRTSFSVLPMRELVADDGLLAQLAARGYTITAP